MVAAPIPKPYKYEARIEMPTPEQATIVTRAVSVDPELRPTEVSRVLRVDGSAIVIEMAATDAKSLRTAVTSIYDFIRVSLRAVAQFST